jgi:hypothetical protein
LILDFINIGVGAVLAVITGYVALLLLRAARDGEPERVEGSHPAAADRSNGRKTILHDHYEPKRKTKTIGGPDAVRPDRRMSAR